MSDRGRIMTEYAREHDALRLHMERRCPELLARLDGLLSIYNDERHARVRAEGDARIAKDEARELRRDVRRLESGNRNAAAPVIVDEDEAECGCCAAELDVGKRAAYCEWCGVWVDWDAARPAEPDCNAAYDAWRDDQALLALEGGDAA